MYHRVIVQMRPQLRNFFRLAGREGHATQGRRDETATRDFQNEAMRTGLPAL